MSHERLDDLKRFYTVLTVLEKSLGGARRLSDCSGRMNWPGRGVYFFQEPGECRTDTGDGQRITRIGTHALKSGSATKIWTRLSQHRGQARSGGGNHRGSIFRLIVGTALIEKDGHDYLSWGQGSSAPRVVRDSEQPLECAVSEVVGEMPFLGLGIEDERGRHDYQNGDWEAHAMFWRESKLKSEDEALKWMDHTYNEN